MPRIGPEYLINMEKKEGREEGFYIDEIYKARNDSTYINFICKVQNSSLCFTLLLQLN